MKEAIQQDDNWRAAGHRYHPYGFAMRRRFGQRVQKVSIDAGFTCPNVDGTVAVGGCVFCDNRSFSPSRRVPRTNVAAQIDEGIRNLQRRYRVKQFIAYFQPATNTYAPAKQLRTLFEEALRHDQVVGLAVGTRPDCVEEDVLDLLTELAERTYVSVEYGMQTMHDRSLKWMNRGCTHAAMIDAVDRSRGRGFGISAHIILGLPGESEEDMHATAYEVARLGVDGIKLHNLYVVKNTPLADQLASGALTLIDRGQYVRMVVDFLERLPGDCVVERLSGDAPPDYFIAPTWCLEKTAVQKAIDAEIERRDTWQGRLYQGEERASESIEFHPCSKIE